MESTGGSSGSTITAAAAMPSPSVVADNSKVFCSSLFKATNYEFDPSISEEEKRFYIKAYPTVDVVRERKAHCTVCKTHIGTAPVQETGIKMHPILRVTHCNKCHDFYNSGEFSKGEDGSELYCRWCGQGGEVYCCSSCPYVFCKSCIVKNLSRGVVADIEQNENWNCFSCAPKILWPLRAQHWALMNYIEQQKKELYALNLSEPELKMNLGKDRSKCCRLAKAKCGNMSDSMESLDSVASKRSHSSSSYSAKKPIKHSATPSPQQMNAAKRAKSNDEVVCTPDLLSMLEPDCQITVSPKPNRLMPTPSASTPKIMSIQQPQSAYGAMTSTPKSSAPPPLVLRNTAIKLRPVAPPPVVRRTIIGPRTPNPGGNGTPVYHTINGYRIDLNSAAQQETFRLPNGKLIQVKRQGPPAPQNASPSINNWQQMSSPQPQRVIPQTIASRAVQITQHPYNISVQQQAQHPQVVRYHSNMIGATTINPVNHNGTTIQVLNGQVTSLSQQVPQQQQQIIQQSGPIRPVMVRHVFPDNTIGQARSGLQDQVFNAMEICTHLTNKVQTLTNSNAYKQARNFLEVKELYIHLSYLLTYAIGRFKSLQDKCLGDMRTLGFGNDADSLENGQLAADKQASDDEDNEIEIVEPKTDLITLDSDDDEPIAFTLAKNQHPIPQNKTQPAYPRLPNSVDVKIKPGLLPSPMNQVTNPIVAPLSTPLSTIANQVDENLDLMSMAQSFLASMLEVDIHEGPFNSPGSDSLGPKKQPRKKLTNKPNPTLLKQKALMERERLEEMKRNDQKLKMKCAVELKKAEEVFPYAKEMLEARAKEKLEEEETKNKENLSEESLTDESVKATVEVVLDDETLNSSTEEKNETECNGAIKPALEDKDLCEVSAEISKETEENKEGKEASIKITEKKSSVEINVQVADKSTEEILPTEEGQIQEEITDKEMKSDDTTNDENQVGDESSKNNDMKENKTNGCTEKEKLTEKMETDEILPPATEKDESMKIDDKEPPQAASIETQDESMKIDDKELPQAASVATHDDNKIIKADKLELEADEEIQQPQKASNEKSSDKETENIVEQHQENDDKNLKETPENSRENELTSPVKEISHGPKNADVEQSNNLAPLEKETENESVQDLPASIETTKQAKDDVTDSKEPPKEVVKNLPVSNEENGNKIISSVSEDLTSREQTNETLTKELEATTTPSNGNA